MSRDDEFASTEPNPGASSAAPSSTANATSSRAVDRSRKFDGSDYTFDNNQEIPHDLGSGDAGRACLRRGWSATPIKRGGKGAGVPWTARQYAPLSVEAFDRIFANGRKWDAALVTGALSGVVVIDLDGPEAIAEFERVTGDPFDPERYVAVRTRRGWHLYFAYPASEEERAQIVALRRELHRLEIKADSGAPVGDELAEASRAYHAAKRVKSTAGREFGRPGFDVRGDGGLAVLPNGRTKAPSPAWLRAVAGAPLSPLPPELLEEVTTNREQTTKQRERAAKRAAERLRPVEPRRPGDAPNLPESVSAYVRRIVEDEIADVEATSEGGRRSALNRAAFSLGTLAGSPWANLRAEDVRDPLERAALRTGLPLDETRKTVDDALRDGMSRPRPEPRLSAAAPVEPPPQIAATVNACKAWAAAHDWRGRGARTERRVFYALLRIAARSGSLEFSRALSTLRLECGVASERTIAHALPRLLERERCPLTVSGGGRGEDGKYRPRTFNLEAPHLTNEGAGGAPERPADAGGFIRERPGGAVGWEALAAGLPHAVEVLCALQRLGGEATTPEIVAESRGVSRGAVHTVLATLSETSDRTAEDGQPPPFHLLEELPPIKTGRRGRPSKRWRLLELDTAEAVERLAARCARNGEAFERKAAAAALAAEFGDAAPASGNLISRAVFEQKKIKARARRHAAAMARPTQPNSEPIPLPPGEPPAPIAAESAFGDALAATVAKTREADARAKERDARAPWDRTELAIVAAADGPPQTAETIAARVSAFGGSWGAPFERWLEYHKSSGVLRETEGGRLVLDLAACPARLLAAARALPDQSLAARGYAVASAGAD